MRETYFTVEYAMKWAGRKAEATKIAAKFIYFYQPKKEAMKISFNWLSEYLSKEVGVQDAVDILTATGLEVDGVEEVASVKGGLSGLVIGEVLTKDKHPDADRLSVTTVNVNNGETLQIVCGAPNVEAGQKVVVAPVGCTIHPRSGDPFEIGKAKIRGVESRGMICAEDEIGLGESHDGIMVLPAEAVPGTLASEYFNVSTDHVIDIALTPNRTDAMGHIGVARDLVAFKSMKEDLALRYVKPPSPSYTDSASVALTIEDVEACPRYSGVEITGVEIKESPDWLKTRLSNIGLTPINNVVDVTNYVLMEYGHPLHAFDLDRIEGGEVKVRKAVAGEKFVTLDDVERELHVDDLVIADASEPMCIAGVFGGANSGISDGTTSIFLESACFDPATVRKTAKRFGLNTDASYRFERGVDREATVEVLERAVALILEVAGGAVSSKLHDEFPVKKDKVEIEVRYTEFDTLIGIQIDRQLITAILNSLEFEVSESGDGIKVVVPGNRLDVTRPCDVIEEVIRIYGFDNVPMSERVSFPLGSGGISLEEQVKRNVATLLSDRGYNEAVNISLTHSSYTSEQAVPIENPISSDLDVLRTDMLSSALQVVAHNVNHHQLDVQFYELGRTYSQADNGYAEEHWLTLFGSGLRTPEGWRAAEEEKDLFDWKGIVTAIVSRVTEARAKWKLSEDARFEVALEISVRKKHVGTIGLIKKGLSSKYGIKEANVWYGELNWLILNELSVSKQALEVKEISRFPKMRRDLAILIDASTRFDEVVKMVNGLQLAHLEEIDVFDVYTGKGVPEGKKSYALSFLYGAADRTLTDAEVDEQMDKIITEVQNAGWTIR